MRSFLFLPGNSPRMLTTGDLLGSDAIVIDLEDAVSPEEKDAARILSRNAIKKLCYKTPLGVRINGMDTAYWQEDLIEILPLLPAFIIVPKVSDAQSVQVISQEMARLEQNAGITMGTVKMIALIETAIGMKNIFTIATADTRLSALFLGAEDLTAELQCTRTKSSEEIAYSRARVVMAARAAGIEAYDTPFTDVGDLEGLVQDAQKAQALGFTGKAAIHPHHLAAIHRIFSPSQKEILYAKEVMATIAEGKRRGVGAVSLRGKMIDAPIVKRAQRILESVQECGTDE